MKNKINKLSKELIIGYINKYLLKIFNITFYNSLPRHATRFAKTYFNGKPITAIEIGVDAGEHAKSMLKELNIERLYLIDAYKYYEDYLNTEENRKRVRRRLITNEKKAKNKLSNYSYKIVWIKKMSDDAINDVPMVDFIYIDGNHDYPYVKKDIELYWEKLKKGGILAGHDISWQGVSKAFCEFVEKYKLNPHISRMDWWIIKK